GPPSGKRGRTKPLVGTTFGEAWPDEAARRSNLRGDLRAPPVVRDHLPRSPSRRARGVAAPHRRARGPAPAQPSVPHRHAVDRDPGRDAPYPVRTRRRTFRRCRRIMTWVILFIAGLLEVVWAVGLKYTEGFSRLVPSIVTAAAL